MRVSSSAELHLTATRGALRRVGLPVNRRSPRRGTSNGCLLLTFGDVSTPQPPASNHFANLFVYHAESRTVHNDDCLCYFVHPTRTMGLITTLIPGEFCLTNLNSRHTFLN